MGNDHAKLLPLLSIIIPTKNRYSTLLPVIASIMSIKTSMLELVLQDNSDDNRTIINYLNNEMNDYRIAYYYSNNRLSQTENSDLAVSHAKGEYISFIGDDDFVMPYIMDVVNWMKRKNIKILKSKTPAYSWPGLPSYSTSKDLRGSLMFNSFKGKYQVVDCKKALIDTLTKGGLGLKSLPCVYHGIVHKTILNNVFHKTGSYFPGPSPDMANAIALAIQNESYTYTDYPVVISGKSNHRMGGLGVLHQHISKIEDVPHLNASVAKLWSDRLPRIWTGPTIYVQSIIDAISRCGKPELGALINYDFLYAGLFVLYYSNRKEIFKGFHKKKYSYKYLLGVQYFFGLRVKAYIKNRFMGNRRRIYNNIVDIKSALQIIEKYILNSNIAPLK